MRRKIDGGGVIENFHFYGLVKFKGKEGRSNLGIVAEQNPSLFNSPHFQFQTFDIFKMSLVGCGKNSIVSHSSSSN